jgi:hypothetical protein
MAIAGWGWWLVLGLWGYSLVLATVGLGLWWRSMRREPSSRAWEVVDRVAPLEPSGVATETRRLVREVDTSAPWDGAHGQMVGVTLPPGWDLWWPDPPKPAAPLADEEES